MHIEWGAFACRTHERCGYGHAPCWADAEQSPPRASDRRTRASQAKAEPRYPSRALGQSGLSAALLIQPRQPYEKSGIAARRLFLHDSAHQTRSCIIPEKYRRPYASSCVINPTTADHSTITSASVGHPEADGLESVIPWPYIHNQLGDPTHAPFLAFIDRHDITCTSAALIV